MTISKPSRQPNGTADMNGIQNDVGRMFISNGTSPPQDKLIVGVDFGTTYSGVAAAYSATPDDVDIIKTWPGGNAVSYTHLTLQTIYSV